MVPMNVLFICSRNKLRSPTAERVFENTQGISVMSAGLAPDAVSPLSPEEVEWADVIFVMERAHRSKLQKMFGAYLKDQRVVCLDIPDDYVYMDPDLVALLQQRVAPHLKR